MNQGKDKTKGGGSSKDKGAVSKKQQKKQQQQQQAQQPAATPTSQPSQGHDNPAHDALYNAVTEQGNKIRNLKSAKAEKAVILVEVEELKKLKAQYKEATGREYAPPSNNQPPANKPATTTMAPTPTTPNIQSPEVELLSQQITQQGDKIRQLKADKVAKDQLKPEIDNLLKLKAQYKEITGSDYQPPSAAANTPKKSSNEKMTSPTPTPALSPEAEKVVQQITLQGDKIRQMKTDKVPQDQLKPEIDALLKLKAQYKELTGSDYQAPGANPKKSSKEKKDSKEKKAPQQPKQQQQQKQDDGKKTTRLGLEALKEEALSD